MDVDYVNAHFIFKIRKVIRYIRLYGLLRTMVKVRGQYHMLSTVNFSGKLWLNPRCNSPEAVSRNVAIIGCGNYSFSNIAYYLAKYDKEFLRCTYDKNKNRSRSLCKFYNGLYATEDVAEIIADPNVKIVFIASNHASHAEYAISCIEHGKSVHIEKPHVVDNQQLERLIKAIKNNPHVNVYLGFNRFKSKLFKKLQTFLKQEQGPMMINWFIAGHAIQDDHWYFDEKEGGRVLGNLCHWTDLTLHLVSFTKAFPCQIIPATPNNSKSDFVVSVIFADRSCASITFSAKGHTFEGVKEVLNVHRGNLVANITDFQKLTCELVQKKIKTRTLYRDHGHKANILNSITNFEIFDAGESIEYIEQTAKFFLAIRQAIDTNQIVEFGL